MWVVVLALVVIVALINWVITWFRQNVPWNNLSKVTNTVGKLISAEKRNPYFYRDFTRQVFSKAMEGQFISLDDINDITEPTYDIDTLD